MLFSHYSRVYSRAWAAMVQLGADEHTLKTFQLLLRNDVKASTAILDLQLFSLLGFGKQGPGYPVQHQMPCGNVSHDVGPKIWTDCPEVQHVHWIQVQAQKNRWEEELLLVKYEMQWTTKSFLHKAQQWEDRFEEPNVNPGPKAYAAWQSSQWRSIVLEADWLFWSANLEYTKIAWC